MGDIYERGRIYLVFMEDQRGYNPKLRPAMVLSESGEFAEFDTLYFVGISTTYNSHKLDEGQFELPYVNDDHGDRETRLKRPSCLMGNWIVEVEQSAIGRRLGTVPP